MRHHVLASFIIHVGSRIYSMHPWKTYDSVYLFCIFNTLSQIIVLLMREYEQ